MDPSSNNEESTITMWPRCLIMQGTSTYFAIDKDLKGFPGTPTSVKKLRSGDLIIQVSKRSHSDNLFCSKMLANCPIHRRMNSKKGVVRCRDLADTSEQVILEFVSSEYYGSKEDLGPA